MAHGTIQADFRLAGQRSRRITATGLVDKKRQTSPARAATDRPRNRMGLCSMARLCIDAWVVSSGTSRRIPPRLLLKQLHPPLSPLRWNLPLAWLSCNVKTLSPDRAENDGKKEKNPRQTAAGLTMSTKMSNRATNSVLDMGM